MTLRLKDFKDYLQNEANAEDVIGRVGYEKNPIQTYLWLKTPDVKNIKVYYDYLSYEKNGRTYERRLPKWAIDFLTAMENLTTMSNPIILGREAMEYFGIKDVDE